MFTTLVTAQELERLAKARLCVFDCRFDLTDVDAGVKCFEQGHIPGATYLHLNQHLSGQIEPGRTGRHPLPERNAFRSLLRQRGVATDMQVVAYDDAGGMFASRLWWLTRWLGHFRVAVLDGGYQAWLNRSALSSAPAVRRSPRKPHAVSMDEVRTAVNEATRTLLDARAKDRFDGCNETIDAKAGHIPRAISAAFQDNLGPDGRFLSPETLRERFRKLLARDGDKPVVCYCGSGVSATHNILAMMHAGLPEPALYAGSWSEWITDPDNPVETR